MKPTIRPSQLHSREELKRLFYRGAPTSALRTGLIFGNCEMLGAFRVIPPYQKPGWICYTWTKTGARTAYLAIIVDNAAMTHRVVEIEQVPWDQWDGAGHGPGLCKAYELFKHMDAPNWRLEWGDYPRRNAAKHREALRARLSDSSPDRYDDTSHPPAASQRTSIWAKVKGWWRR